MTVSLSPIGNGVSFFGTSLVLLNGGFLNTYQAGTSTPLATYTTNLGNVANTNPIVLNSDGRPPQEIWLTSGVAYKFVLSDALSNIIATYDNIIGPDSTANALAAALITENDSTKGAALIGYTDPYAPTYLKTVSDIINGLEVSVFRFIPPSKFASIRAKTNVDDLLQNFTDAMAAGSYCLTIPAGQYLFSGTVPIPNAMEIKGAGPGTISVLAGTSGTQSMFSVTAQTAVEFRDVCISSTVAKTAGIAITFDPGATFQNNQSVIENVYFSGQFQAVDWVRAAYWTMKNNHFVNNQGAANIVRIRNLTTFDSGDQTFENNWFYGASGTGLRYESGGSLRVRGNKFLQLNVGIDANFPSGVATGIFLCNSNSFDGCAAQSLSMVTADNTVTFNDINISDNIFSGSPSVSHVYASPAAGSSQGRALVSGNNLLRNTGATPVIQIIAGGNWNIIGNTINGPAVVGISIGAAVTDSLVAANQIEGMSISNGSSTTLVIDTKVGGTPIMSVGGHVGVGTSSVGASVTNCLAMANTAAPTSSPTGVGQVYVEAGALKYRGAGGTITVIAPT